MRGRTARKRRFIWKLARLALPKLPRIRLFLPRPRKFFGVDGIEGTDAFEEDGRRPPRNKARCPSRNRAAPAHLQLYLSLA